MLIMHIYTYVHNQHRTSHRIHHTSPLINYWTNYWTELIELIKKKENSINESVMGQNSMKRKARTSKKKKRKDMNYAESKCFGVDDSQLI